MIRLCETCSFRNNTLGPAPTNNKIPAYDRIDLAALILHTKKKRKVTGYWVFSIYKLYSRLNPYFIYFDQTGSPLNGDLKVEARQVSLFPILPAVTWNFKF